MSAQCQQHHLRRSYGREAQLPVLCFLPTFAPLFWNHMCSGSKPTCVYSEMAWRCLFCAGFSALLVASLLTHYNSEHYHCHEERNFNIRCQIDGCTKEYSKVNSFTKHVHSYPAQVRTILEEYLFCLKVCVPNYLINATLALIYSITEND